MLSSSSDFHINQFLICFHIFINFGKFYLLFPILASLSFIVFSTVHHCPRDPFNFPFISAIFLFFNFIYFSFCSIDLHCIFSYSHTISSLASYVNCFVLSVLNTSLSFLNSWQNVCSPFLSSLWQYF